MPIKAARRRAAFILFIYFVNIGIIYAEVFYALCQGIARHKTAGEIFACLDERFGSTFTDAPICAKCGERMSGGGVIKGGSHNDNLFKKY